MQQISARLKLERATEHIIQLERLLDSFWGSEPYQVFNKDYEQAGTRMRSWYVSGIRDVPPALPILTADALQNLRTALDHLIHHCIFKETKIWPTKRIICFPIGEDSTKNPPPEFGGRVQGLGQAGKQLLERLKPYQGGNTALWRLHSLNNIDKHRMLITAYNSLSRRSTTQSDRERMLKMFLGSYPNATKLPDLSNSFIKTSDVDFPLKNGSILAAVPFAELEQNMSFTFDISFNEPEAGVVGEPVVDVLRTFEFVVGNVIEQFEKAGLT